MALYFYFNETTGDLVYSDQATYGVDGYAALGEQTNMNPTADFYWVFDSKRKSIKTVNKDPAIGGSIFGLTNMVGMFIGCSSLANVDLSSFDTSKVTDMSSMFSGCSSLASVDLSSFDTSKVTRMDGMFGSCSALTSVDLSGFDTSKVTNMSSMFSNCSSLTSLDLSGFDTSKVTSMGGMFGSCSSLRFLAIGGSMSNVLSRLPASQYYPASGGDPVAKADLTAGTWIRDLGDRDLLTSLAQQSSAFKALSDRLGRLEEKVLGSSQAPSYGTSVPNDKLTSIVAQAQAVMSLRRRISALAKQAVKLESEV